MLFLYLLSHTAADHPHCFSCKLELASDQDIPTDWFPFITVECEVADTAASQTRVKSLGTESDIQPQKHISYRTFYRCQVKPDLNYSYLFKRGTLNA